MVVHLRVSVADRPGMLARVTAALADAGADIKSITVLERVGDRAVDDIYITWSSGDFTDLAARLEGLRGVRVLGIRRTRQIPGAFPDLDLLAQVLATGTRGLDTLVDMAVAAFDADWAARISYPGGSPQIAYWSGTALDDVIVPPERFVRATAFEREGVPLVAVPLDPFDAALVCGRGSTPAFHRVEVERIARVTALAVGLARPVGFASH
ncbi:MAG: ACT domain-containing protein [Acidothermus sp.]|nr:ACT domain-containing protein [Acidothermus sp.]MCL6538126.1 ACT domain-containing protein [Acidothermus sp.]